MPSHTIHPRSRGRRHLGADGFTLVEVTCAAFVMLFAIASSVVAMQFGFRSIDMARGTTVASQILQSEIENVRLLAWEDIILLSPQEELDYTGSVEEEIAKRLIRVERTVQAVGGATDMREITITATWKTTDGITHTRSTSTRYCRNGLNDFLATDPNR